MQSATGTSEPIRVADLPRLEELLTEEEFLQLRYLSCQLVSEHISNDYGLVAYVVYHVLRSWGYTNIFITAAFKRQRTVGTVEDANNFFNPKYTDDLDKVGKQHSADVALVVVQPCKIVNDDAPDDRPIPFAAITDLFMTPELDLPIYSMQKRNALSPLAMVPQIKVNQYVLLANPNEPAAKKVRESMRREERERLDEMIAMFSGEDPGARYIVRAPHEVQTKVRRLIDRFAKPFTTETRPNEQFFKFFQVAMDRVRALGG